MKEAYMALHKQGHVHSFECYLDSELVGGVYGVSIGGTFAAESMFYRYPNASKAILWVLGQFLFAEGVKWIDCQIINPHLVTLGTEEISRADFIEEHQKAIKKGPIYFSAKRLSTLLSSLEILQKPKSSRPKGKQSPAG